MLPRGYVDIVSIGGYCPVQADGTIGGNPFYFRARHDYWTLTIAKPGDDPVDACLLYGQQPSQAIYHHRQDYGPEGQHTAGYMSLQEARRFIRTCAAAFYLEQGGKSR